MTFYNPFRKIEELKLELDDVKCSLQSVRRDRDYKNATIAGLLAEKQASRETILNFKLISKLLLIAFTVSLVFNIYFFEYILTLTS